jgi:predicted permease
VANFILIFLCLGLGLLLRRLRILNEQAAHALNRFVIYISLPAVALKQMHYLNLHVSAIYAVIMPWLLFALGVLFFTLAGRVMKMSPKTLGSLVLTGSLGNTSFVGFPLLEALYGAGALATGVLVDQPGTFLVAGTLGIIVACIFSGTKVSGSYILKRVFSFPPFLAILVSIFLKPVQFAPEFDIVLDKLGNTLIPLSLVAVGLQLHIKKDSLLRESKFLALGLAFKLVIAPLFFIGLYRFVLRLSGGDVKIILIESAMAPMITAGVIASEYGLNAELANLMIGIGIPLSLLTVPLWAAIIN